jgi:preprotein translocase subunit SecA
MVTRAIEKAQKKVEDYNFEVRKSLLEYDEVMDQQRKTIYGVRQEVLEAKGTREKVEQMLTAAIVRAASVHAEDAAGFAGWWQKNFGFEIAPAAAESAVSKEGSTDDAVAAVMTRYGERESELTEELMRRVEQYLLLNAIDSRWKDHLHAIDALKTGIGLRGYGQQDPKNEYKREGFKLFENLFAAVEDEVTSLILRIKVQGEAPPAVEAPPAGESVHPAPQSATSSSPAPSADGADSAQPAPRPPVAAAPPRRQAAAVSASHAFDVKRQQELVAERMRKLQEQRAAQTEGSAHASGSAAAPHAASAPVKVAKVDRNDPCPCGSGKKYKKCHGAGA